MITFSCGNCGRRIRAGDGSVGKKGTCPGCGTIVTVPDDLPLELQKEEKPEQKIVLADRIKPQTQEFFSYEEQEEKPPERKLPFALDIFLYPTSTAGLTIIGIVFGIPFLIGVIAALAGPFGFFISIPGFFINIVVYAYFFWYLCECIRDSAEGNIRAPDVLVNAPTLGDMGWEMLRITICLFLFLGPSMVYYRNTGETDTVFWMLLAAAVLLFPVALLAVVMHGSIVALNPFLWIKAIVHTFFPYLGLVILFGFFAVFVVYMAGASALLPDVISFVILPAYLYTLTIMAHLLGRFYWRYSGKLDWEV